MWWEWFFCDISCVMWLPICWASCTHKNSCLTSSITIVNVSTGTHVVEQSRISMSKDMPSAILWLQRFMPHCRVDPISLYLMYYILTPGHHTAKVLGQELLQNPTLSTVLDCHLLAVIMVHQLYPFAPISHLRFAVFLLYNPISLATVEDELWVLTVQHGYGINCNNGVYIWGKPYDHTQNGS